MKRWSFLAILVLSTSAMAHVQHEDAERDFKPAYAALATGVVRRSNQQKHAWPVSVLSIGHTNASYQAYGGEPYFHHGLDIRAEAGSAVYAAVGGKVVNVENYQPGDSAYWEIAILDDDGFIWQYHHVDRNSIPQSVFQAFKTGGRVETGSKLGEVFFWGVVTFGERYHHIHLNVIGKDKKFVSPFLLLQPLADQQAPTIKQVKVLKKSGGRYTLTAEVADYILHTKFLVPPHVITYSVDGGAFATTWNFDELPGGDQISQYVDDLYASGTCGNYSCRKAIIDLGFRKDNAQVFPLSSGKHSVLVRVADFAGNVAEKEFSWVNQ